MSESEWRDEIKRLREEIAALKEQLKVVKEKGERKRGRIYIDINHGIRDYVEDVMEGIFEGISSELEKSVLIGPHGVAIRARAKPRVVEKEIEGDPVEIASIMSALGNEHRIRILRELMRGGKYVSELQEKLPEITPSTLSSHLDLLQDAGLIVQEKVRGRYLITMPGRIAYRMAVKIHKMCRGRLE